MLNSPKRRNRIVKFLKHTSALSVLLVPLAPAAWAQPFAYTNNDLALGFRKTSIHQESYEAVVNIGSATNYVDLAPGTTISVPNFTASQLTPDTFSDLTFLSWSVTGFSKTNTAFVLPGYVNNTLWLTVPRADANMQSSAPQRLNYAQQGSVVTQVKSILSGAAYLSSQSSAGPDNTTKFVREPVNNSANLSAFVGSIVDSSQGTLRDAWPQTIESTTPANFSGSSTADFYEVRPTNDPQGNPVTDRHTGQTSGDAYYVGYFTLSYAGTLTFTRGSSGTVTNPPPTAPTLTVARTGTTTQISFTADKGATYKLYYTGTAGLTQPLTSWATAPTTITGDGSTQTFSDTTTDSVRFYRVSAQ